MECICADYVQGSQFLNQFRAVDHGGFDSAWNDINHLQVRENVPPQFQEFDNIYIEGVGSQQQPIMDGNVEVH